jgi:hypothetical protein
MKQLLLTSTIIALSALPLSAQEVAKSGKFASIVKNIGNALNIGQGEEAVESEVNTLAVDAANAGLDQVEDKVSQHQTSLTLSFLLGLTRWG